MGCQAENQGVTKWIFAEFGHTNTVCPVPGVLIGEKTLIIFFQVLLSRCKEPGVLNMLLGQVMEFA